MKIYEPNYTQVPNIIIEKMPDFSEAEFKLVMAIVRKTIGWQKLRDKISLTQLQTLTGMSRASINEAVKSKKLAGIIQVHHSKKGNEFELIVHEAGKEESQIEANRGSTDSELSGSKVVQNLNHGSTESEPIGSTKSEHTKETITKETIQKKEARARIAESLKNLPPPVQAKKLFQIEGFKDAYLDYRVYLKDKYSFWPNEVEVKRDYLKLLELMKAGNPPVDVINQTIDAKAKSFFPIRNYDNKKSKNRTHGESRVDQYARRVADLIE